MKRKIVKGTHALMRDLNRTSILNIIREKGPISRSSIAALLNVSIPTVMRVTDSLLADGMITYTGKGDSSGGRKPPLLEINSTGGFIFGAHVGSQLDIVLSNLKAEVIDSLSIPTGEFMEPEAIIRQIAVEINRMVDINRIPEAKVFGVGIGTPGVNFKANPEIETSAFKGWNHANLEHLTKKYIKYKTFTENISRTTTLRECWFGNAKGRSNVLHLLVDKGIGGGIILNGKPYLGVNGKAGELGHISVEFNGEKCYCGNRGCIETYASIPAILNRVNKHIRSVYPSNEGSGFCEQSMSFEKICKLAEQDDNFCRSILTDAAKRFGAVIANLVNVFDPEIVVLSGSVIFKSPLFFETSCQEAMEKIFTYRDVQKKVEIVRGNDKIAPALGSVALVLQSIF